MNQDTKIVIIQNFASHYTRRTYEILSERYKNLFFYFYSKGDEWFWPDEHGVERGHFNHQYLSGFSIFGRRITPSLITKLFSRKFHLIVQGIGSPFVVLTSFFISKFKGTPFILWTGIWGRLGTPYHRLIFPAVRVLYKHSDAIIVYGNHVKKYLLEEGISAEKIFVAPHAIDNSKYNRTVTTDELSELKEHLGILDNKKIILYLGRLEPFKGLDYLIEAFNLLDRNDTVMIIAGNGSAFPALQEIVRDKGRQDDIYFPGYIEVSSTVVYYALADLFVLPSITTKTFKEPWGLVINEALNQRLPIVATDAVGAAEGGLVENNANGYVVKEKDAEELAEKIGLILDDDQKRSNMGEESKRKINQWTQERMVANFGLAFEYVMNKQDN